VQTNPHNGDEWYANQRAISIEARLLDHVWRDGFRYFKADVILSDLSPAGQQGRYWPAARLRNRTNSWLRSTLSTGATGATLSVLQPAGFGKRGHHGKACSHCDTLRG